MITTKVPDLASPVSVISLGTGGFGSTQSEELSFAMLDCYAEAGGNLADSAHIYAAWLPDGVGQSERTLGKWLASRRPQDFIVSTKGGHPHLDSMDVSRLSPECLAADITESLERLGVDSIDLYWLHRDDERVPVGEIMSALAQHVRSGALKALGASNWSPARINAANDYAARNSLTPFCASQIGWSLARTNSHLQGVSGLLLMDDDILQWHDRTGFPAFAYSSQANGYFAHPLPQEGIDPTPKQQALAVSYGSEANARRHLRVATLATELGYNPNQIALASIYSHPFPAIAIVGPRDLAQLEESMGAADLRLSAGQLHFLDS